MFLLLRIFVVLCIFFPVLVNSGYGEDDPFSHIGGVVSDALKILCYHKQIYKRFRIVRFVFNGGNELVIKSQKLPQALPPKLFS